MLASHSPRAQAPSSCCSTSLRCCTHFWDQDNSSQPSALYPVGKGDQEWLLDLLWQSHCKVCKSLCCRLETNIILHASYTLIKKQRYFLKIAHTTSTQFAIDQNLTPWAWLAARKTGKHSFYSGKPHLHCGKKWNKYWGTPAYWGELQGDQIELCPVSPEVCEHQSLMPEPSLHKPEKKRWLHSLKAEGERGGPCDWKRTSLVLTYGDFA